MQHVLLVRISSNWLGGARGPRDERHEHMKKAHNIPVENIHTYWDYPAPAGRDWPGRLRDHIGNIQEIGVEPGLRQEIALQLHDYSLRVEPLVERLRLVKSEAEIKMIRRAAQYADFGVERCWQHPISGRLLRRVSPKPGR